MRRVWLLLVAALVVLGVSAPGAKAATPINSYGYLTTFGNGETFPFIEQFGGVAVDSSNGNIFLAKEGASVVDVFEPDAVLGGTPLTSFEAESAGSVAVDSATGAVYVSNGLFGGQFSGGLKRFESDGASPPAFTEDPTFAPPVGVPVNTGGITVDPTTGDVMAATNETVYRLSSSGAQINTYDGQDTAKGHFGLISTIAVGPNGVIYVVDRGLNKTRVEKLSPNGTSLGSLPIDKEGRPFSVTVNQENGDVYLIVNVQGRNILEGFNSAGQRIFRSPFASAASGGLVGIAADGSRDRIYVGTDEGLIHVFAPAIQPGLDAPVISQVGPAGAHVESTVAPGGQPTTLHVEYCSNSAACETDSAAWVALPDHAPVSTDTTLPDDITGLLPSETYFVRSTATNGVTENTSAVASFTTEALPPQVQTGLASDISDTGAELSGTVDTLGAQTTYHFEYGLTTAYGSNEPAGAEAIAGNDRRPHTFRRSIAGLEPGTEYHFRLVAENAGGITLGADQTFTTLRPDQLAPRREYEQVTPVDKQGGSIDTIFGFQAAEDGGAIQYALTAAPPNATAAPQKPRFISRRGADDWLNWESTDPPLNVGRQLVHSVTLAVSPDFEHALVASNRALTPGAIEGGGNLYVSNLRTGEYELVSAFNSLSGYLNMVGPHAADVYIAGAPDFSWLVLVSKEPLLAGVKTTAMYRWTEDGGLTLESVLPDGSIPAGAVWYQPRTVLATREVSDDGSVSYFSLTNGEGGVYRRAGGQTTAISVSHIGGPSTPQPGTIDGVSRDGRYAIFDSRVKLTNDAENGVRNLYRYDSSTDDLTYLGTADGAPAPGNTIIGVSEDAQTVYWDNGSGTEVSRNGIRKTVSSARPNTNAEGLEAHLSPNGRFLAYRVTGDVYLYDADADKLSCMSCLGDGSPGGTALLPFSERNISNRTPQVVLDDGTAFFDTERQLISADRNGSRDVYEFRDGRLALISPGDGNFTARFADISADGTDVYFTTAESLVGQDQDQAIDIYDARVGGGFAKQWPPPPPVPCQKAECAEAGTGPVASPPVASSSPKTSQKKLAFAISKVSVGRKGVSVRFHVSGPGRVSITGSKVKATSKRVNGEGIHSVLVPLKESTHAAIEEHRSVSIGLNLRFTSQLGSVSKHLTKTVK